MLRVVCLTAPPGVLQRIWRHRFDAGTRRRCEVRRSDIGFRATGLMADNRQHAANLLISVVLFVVSFNNIQTTRQQTRSAPACARGIGSVSALEGLDEGEHTLTSTGCGAA